MISIRNGVAGLLADVTPKRCSAGRSEPAVESKKGGEPEIEVTGSIGIGPNI